MPEVHRHVMESKKRMVHLARIARELGDRIRPYQLVLHGGQGDPDPRHLADGRAPDPRADEHPLALDRPAIRVHPVNTPIADVEPGDPHATLERDTARLG